MLLHACLTLKKSFCPGLVTLCITRTKKLHCRRNTTSYYNIKYDYGHKIILSGTGKKKKRFQISLKVTLMTI